MLAHVTAFLKASWGPAPAWLWLVCLVALPAINEVINRAKWTKAQSVFQALIRAFLIPPFGRIPVIGDLLAWMAGPEPVAPRFARRPPSQGGYTLPGVMCGVGIVGIVLACLLAGCATLTAAQRAQGAAYAACMESKGIAAAGAVGQEAWTDLNTGADSATILTQLQGLAGRAGIDAVSCAIGVWLHPTQPSMLNPAGVVAAKAWMAGH